MQVFPIIFLWNQISVLVDFVPHAIHSVPSIFVSKGDAHYWHYTWLTQACKWFMEWIFTFSHQWKMSSGVWSEWSPHAGEFAGWILTCNMWNHLQSSSYTWIVTPISCSCINTIWLGRRWPRVPGARLAIQSQGCSQPMAHLGGCVIWLPALQLLSHQPLHLFPVDFTVPAQSFILNTLKDISWKCSFQTEV